MAYQLPENYQRLQGQASAAARVMSLPSWITNRRAWEKPTIGNVVIPGVVRLTGGALKLRIESNKSSGNDASSSLIKGLEQPTFGFQVSLTSREDELEFDKLIPILIPRKNPQARDALPVFHPILAKHDINNCLVSEINPGFPEPGGHLVYEISCIAVSPDKLGATKKVNPKGAGGKGPIAPIIDLDNPRGNQATTSDRQKLPPQPGPAKTKFGPTLTEDKLRSISQEARQSRGQ